MKWKRRDFLLASSAAVAAAPVNSGFAQPRATAALAVEESWNDGLAHPVSYAPQFGKGKERGLVVGGGGVYLLSWLLGYFTTLKENGVDISNTDIAVGTSAGSFLSAALLTGDLERLAGEFNTLGESPELFAKLVPAIPPNPSQIRASRFSSTTEQAGPDNIQAIGRAAMAAHNPAGPERYPASVEHLLGNKAWPSGLYTTAVDCYTGERLVVTQEDGIPIYQACAASSSLPGITGPVWLKDRLSMDGAIWESSTHADIVSGVKKALVISLTDGTMEAARLGLRNSSLPNTLREEIRQLEAQGTEVMLKVVGLRPGLERVDSIMNPAHIKPNLKRGREQGQADSAEMRKFWNS